MGCHSWTYKKVTSFDKDTLVEEIQNQLNKEFQSFVYSTDRETYAKQLHESNQEDKKYSPVHYDRHKRTIEDWAKVWDEYQVKKKSALRDLGKFMKSDNKNYHQEFVDFILKHKLDSCYLVEHKGEYYIFIMFDTKFRCHVFSNDFFDNYDDLIDYLSKCPEHMVVQYDEDYNQTTGLTDELQAYLKELYQYNDIIVEFG